MKRNGFYFEVYCTKNDPYSDHDGWEANLKCGVMNMECSQHKTKKEAVSWCKNYFNKVPIVKRQ